MYHQPTKRKQLIQRITLYGAMTLAVIILVTILVFVTLGYQINTANGKVEQGGLIQLDSAPTGAAVSIDGNDQGVQTTGKASVLPGAHYITMTKQNYQTWQKTVNVLPGEVLWLTYARLVPDSLPVKSVASFATVSSTAASFNNKYMAIQVTANQPTIELANLQQNPPKVTTLTIPNADYTAPSDMKTQTFSLITWDPGNRYLLVKHTYLQGTATQTEWIVVDTQSINDTKNVTTLLGIEASKLIFSGSSSQTLYAQTGTDVRKIDLGADTLSRPLITNVDEFSLYNNSTLVYTTLADTTTKLREVGYYTAGANSARTVHSYPDDGTPIHIAVGDYYNQTYLTQSYGSQVTISELKNGLPDSDSSSLPTLTQVSSFKLAPGVGWLTFQGSGRFVVAQASGSYDLFDLELNKLTTTTLNGTAPVTTQIQWLDDYHPWSDRNGMLRMYEFDGANQANIMTVVPGFSAMFGPNGTYLYGIGKAKNGSEQLQRVQMIL